MRYVQNIKMRKFTKYLCAKVNKDSKPATEKTDSSDEQDTVNANMKDDKTSNG